MLIKLAVIFLCMGTCFISINAQNVDLQAQIKTRVAKMSVMEKLGQKLMLDFRYWCSEKTRAVDCKQPWTQMNSEIANLMRDYHIGGLILFRENIVSEAQLFSLTRAAQAVMQAQTGLLIGLDQEGGIVTRLPAQETASFSGNMAISAATLGRPGMPYALAVGRALGHQLKAVGVNINFAPDVDVNSNPYNPIINVRAFSDLPAASHGKGEALTASSPR